jgi:hypothetical protein
MGIELLLIYLAMMVVIGPGTILFGILIIVRQEVRLTRSKNLRGGTAVASGIFMLITGFVFSYFLWYMGRFFPH